MVDAKAPAIEEVPVEHNSKSSGIYEAVAANRLIGYHGTRYFLADWPDLIPRGEVEAAGKIRFLRFVGDRSRFVVVEGQKLICRSSADLGVIWERPIDPGFDLSKRLSLDFASVGPGMASTKCKISADGSTVALGVSRFSDDLKSRYRYFELLDGRTGALVARRELEYTSEFALSADGKYLAYAVAGSKVGKGGSADFTILETESWKPVARLRHATKEVGGMAGLTADAQFLGDGRTLVTSSNTAVRVWDWWPE